MDFFAGKVAVVTGGARGIGFAAARELGRRGARIVVSDLSEDALQEAAASLRASGTDVLTLRSDVTKPEDCTALVESALDRFGRIDILVNNAGVSVVDAFENCTPETARKLYEVNLLGQVFMTLAALPAIKASKGYIVFMASVSGIRAMPTGSLYASSKAALRSLAEAIRLELKPHGVHVGVLSPGFTVADPRKTVMKGNGSPRPIHRPPHDTPEGVARALAKLIERRKREMVLTPLGKLVHLLQRLSPSLLDLLQQGREIPN